MGILDLFNNKNLIEWQNVVYSKKCDSLKFSKRQLIALTEDYIPQSKRIIDDCVRLVNNTTTVEVFFSRYDLLLELYEGLAIIEKHYNKFAKPLPSSQLMYLKNEKEKATNDLINRCWDKTTNEVSKLKTDKAKAKRFEKLFESFNEHSSSLFPSNINLLESLKTLI